MVNLRQLLLVYAHEEPVAEALDVLVLRVSHFVADEFAHAHFLEVAQVVVLE